MQAQNKEQDEVLEWIGEVLGQTMPKNVSFEDQLRDGVVLCHLINKICPDSVKKIQTKGTNFQLMENIQRCVYCSRVHIIEKWFSNNII